MPHPLDHLAAFTDHLFENADTNCLDDDARDALSALKDAAEQLFMAADALSRGEGASALDVAVGLTIGAGKLAEAQRALAAA